MNTFKQSAIEILRKAKTPLHYNEITKQALEAGILETEGAKTQKQKVLILLGLKEVFLLLIKIKKK